MTILSVQAPGGYVPQTAISFGTTGGDATSVDAAHPLPVAISGDQRAAGSASLAGTASASTVAGPFVPELGRAIWVTLGGTWTGTVTVRRSTDGGATKLPLTFIDGSAKGVWSASVNAAIGEESVAGARWFLDIALTSGSLTYRVEQ